MKNSQYLEIKVIRKMLNRFLSEKKMKCEELAKALHITAEELNQLLFLEETLISKDLIAKVNLPLIQLYCETRWYRG